MDLLLFQVKPCKSLWVGGISPSVSKDDLEEEFSKFGKIQDFRFLRERKTAFVDYYEMDDALQAKSMNGKRMGGSYLHVDYLRSQAPRKVSTLLTFIFVFFHELHQTFRGELCLLHLGAVFTRFN